jgi:hypothetical protein
LGYERKKRFNPAGVAAEFRCMALQKHKSITELLDRLRTRLGTAAFDVIDHWEGDLCAVGVARPDEHGILVYVSTFGEPEGSYFVSLELPPPSWSWR